MQLWEIALILNKWEATATPMEPNVAPGLARKLFDNWPKELTPATRPFSGLPNPQYQQFRDFWDSIELIKNDPAARKATFKRAPKWILATYVVGAFEIYLDYVHKGTLTAADQIVLAQKHPYLFLHFFTHIYPNKRNNKKISHRALKIVGKNLKHLSSLEKNQFRRHLLSFKRKKLTYKK